VNASVTFDASSSSDADPFATLQARWDWEGDGSWDTTWTSTLIAQHVFVAAGVYPVKLEILDSRGFTDNATQYVAVGAAGGGDTTPPQVTIVSPSNDTVVAASNVTVTGFASDNVAISVIEVSTDNQSWMPTSGTTTWSGTVPLKAGTNRIYVRATDTSGNRKTAIVTVIAQHPDQSQPPLGAAGDPAIPVLLAMAGIGGLIALHAILWNRSRTSPNPAKTQTNECPARRGEDRRRAERTRDVNRVRRS